LYFCLSSYCWLHLEFVTLLSHDSTFVFFMLLNFVVYYFPTTSALGIIKKKPEVGLGVVGTYTLTMG